MTSSTSKQTQTKEDDKNTRTGKSLKNFFYMREYKIKFKMTNRNSTLYAVLFGENSIGNENSLENENDTYSCFCLDTFTQSIISIFFPKHCHLFKGRLWCCFSQKYQCSLFTHLYLEYSVSVTIAETCQSMLVELINLANYAEFNIQSQSNFNL